MHIDLFHDSYYHHIYSAVLEYNEKWILDLYHRVIN